MAWLILATAFGLVILTALVLLGYALFADALEALRGLPGV